MALRFFVQLLLIGLPAAWLPAYGQQYPTRPITIVVGFPAAGPTDLVARLFSEHAHPPLGQPLVVENKPGANSIIATEAVASAAPDGYTLLMAAQNHAIIPALYADRIKFDGLKSFTPICIVAESPDVLVVSSNLGVKTLDEFMRKVREKPGAYTYASVGTGSAVHLATADFLSMAKLSMNHIPYKGAAPASTAILAGEVDAYLASAGSVLAYIKAGRVIPLAVASSERSRLLPDVPTFAEQGVAGFKAAVWYALLAPAATPAAVVQVLEREASDFARDPAVAQRLVAAGVEPQLTCGAGFRDQLAKEIDANKRLVRTLDLKVD